MPSFLLKGESTMKKKNFVSVITVCCFLALSCALVTASGSTVTKPGPDEALAMLKAGNERFVTNKATQTHRDPARLALAGTANQGDYAYATVITCSDSRVPVEILFDAGIMDIFVVRVAGNVMDVDEAGSVEYGLAHVQHPGTCRAGTYPVRRGNSGDTSCAGSWSCA